MSNLVGNHENHFFIGVAAHFAFHHDIFSFLPEFSSIILLTHSAFKTGTLYQKHLGNQQFISTTMSENEMEAPVERLKIATEN